MKKNLKNIPILRSRIFHFDKYGYEGMASGSTEIMLVNNNSQNRKDIDVIDLGVVHPLTLPLFLPLLQGKICPDMPAYAILPLVASAVRVD